jgi:hypothetical protein
MQKTQTCEAFIYLKLLSIAQTENDRLHQCSESEYQLLGKPVIAIYWWLEPNNRSRHKPMSSEIITKSQ